MTPQPRAKLTAGQMRQADRKYQRMYKESESSVPGFLDVAAAEEDRLKRLPRPPAERKIIAIEFDDVVATSTRLILEGLTEKDQAQISVNDMESAYLFQCKGFGTLKGKLTGEDLRH
jgi:hypothetical protein